MNKASLILFFVLCGLGIFAANTANDFVLPGCVQIYLHKLDSYFNRKPRPANTEENPSIEIPSVFDRNNSGHTADHLIYSGNAFHCKQNNLGAIKKSNEQTVYKWLDEKGRVHFGDSAPDNKLAEAITLDGTPAYFELLVQTDRSDLPRHFKQDLRLRVNKSYDWLANVLPRELLQKVQVNLFVFNSRSAYYKFQKMQAPNIVGSSLGFHSSKNNIAAAYRKNDEQLLRTSVHEAVHVMNAGIFGYLPRWLNEGLAEYLELIKLYDQVVEFQPSKHKFRRLQLSPMSVRSVFSADRKAWQGQRINILYAHSWGLVYFLMSSNSGQKVLSEFLVASSKSPCQKLNSYNFFEQNYNGGMQRLEHDFRQWQRNKPITQRF